MPGDLEPSYAIGIAHLAMTVLAADGIFDEDPTPGEVSRAIRIANDVLHATALDLCKRANEERRKAEIARGSIAKGGDS